ncbi:hypothetical protein RHECIAT_CH0000946 [Rhizobium etli CIAT 652]|uniref:Uncharacterized protein n=1 Tax=Rhizobium etli (strain CIAT 652) TaxID=491916 RepID=B3PRE8_RHIE6|nr:hypothetical protein RHECIAT_CH0000946 [Rhizobium etli CIAT 652]KKZ87619.1 hypothetical protein RPHASCH2410_CH11265 [Rhizobium phaseoli Ch24-10]
MFALRVPSHFFIFGTAAGSLASGNDDCCRIKCNPAAALSVRPESVVDCYFQLSSPANLNNAS